MFIRRAVFDKLFSDRRGLEIENAELQGRVTELEQTIELLKIYKNIVVKRVDDSIKDPLMDNIRVLLPDEVESIKDTSLQILKDKSKYAHHRCAMTNLLLIRSLISDEPSQRSTETKTETKN